MAASRKVQDISTKYFMCINRGNYVIYLQNMKFERLILWPGGAYTDAMHFLIHESWLHRLIGKYPKWAKNFTSQGGGGGGYVIWTLWNPLDFSMKFGGFHTKDHFARDGKAYVYVAVHH